MTQSAEDGEDGQGMRRGGQGRRERLARSLFSRVSGTLSALLARIAHTYTYVYVVLLVHFRSAELTHDATDN